MSTLDGARVALLEARMSGELASLVERFGGRPYSVPAVREMPIHHPEEVRAFIEALCAGRFQYIVLLTGVGVKALVREAERLGRVEDALAALRQATTVCRGPKPSAVLKQHNVPIGISPREPYTTKELLDELQAVDLRGAMVALVHYGERSGELADALRSKGAQLDEICLYEWLLPADVEPLKKLVGDLIDGDVDAVAFTSQVQIRHLFLIANEIGRSAALVDALNDRVVVAAIGPVSASALREVGVIPRVQPAHPKMGPMVIALADYFDLTRR